jgi:hypothetical protein
MHADSLLLVLHICDISQWIDFHCLTLWFNLHNPNSEVANIDPLLRFQRNVGTKSYVLNVGTPVVENLISRKIIHNIFLLGFGWDRKINLKKSKKILNKKD